MTFRRLLCLALLPLLAQSEAVAAQGTERWSLKCEQTEDGRRCDLILPLGIRVRKSPEPPVVAAWSMLNRPMGIVERFEVRIDDDALPGHRFVGIGERQRSLLLPARPYHGDVKGADVLDAMADGKDLTVLLIEDATGRQTVARLSADGFNEARAALMNEVARGANHN